MSSSPPSTEASPSQPAGSRVRAWRWLLVGVGALGLGMLAWHGRAPKPEPPSELASKLVRRDGRLFAAGAPAAFTGWMLERYPDAALKSRSWISNGLLQGVSEGWFTNGIKQVQEHFAAGVSEGPVAKWHPDGAKLSAGTARGGKLEGRFRRWHTNGILSEEVMLLAGQPDGLSRAWFPNGSLKAEATMKLGQVVTQKFWKDGERPPETAGTDHGGRR